MTEDANFPVRRSGRTASVAARALTAEAVTRTPAAEAGLGHAFLCRAASDADPWPDLGLSRAPLLARQVHGNGVAAVPADGSWPGGEPPEADALVTAARGLPLAVLTADCVPVIIWDRRTPALAVVHAGWRGIVAGTAGAALSALAGRYGTRPAECAAAIGPAIAGPCYEVGEEVAAALRAAGPGADAALRPGRTGHWWADVKELVRRQLVRGGVRPEAVAVCPYCTHCAGEWFHSARRDGAAAGRQATVAWLA